MNTFMKLFITDIKNNNSNNLQKWNEINKAITQLEKEKEKYYQKIKAGY